MPRFALVLYIGASLLLYGCGGGDSTAAEVGGKSVVGDTKVLRGALVSQKLIDRQPMRSPLQALMRFWSSLQYQAWSDAASAYEPGLVAVIGQDKLVDALAHQGSYFRSTKPTGLSVLTNAGRKTVRFVVKGTSGDAVARSITFRKTAKGWKIFYDPFLNEALRSSAQAATQLTVDPSSDKLSRKALVAGDAASRLQSKWLQQAEKPQASPQRAVVRPKGTSG